MGCNILLLVVLLCGLPPVYITVFGYPEGCPEKQQRVPCNANGTSPEKTCPGVGVFCGNGEKVCGCADSLYRNNKFRCVSAEGCVERKYETFSFLKQQEAIYLVGISKYPPHSRLPYRCMRLILRYATRHESNRELMYEVRKGHEKEGSNKVHERKDDDSKWEEKQLWLVYWFQSKDDKVLRFFVRGERSSTEMPGSVDVVHATHQCLITGTRSKRNGKYDCTLWVKKSLVGQVPDDCDFIFKELCNNAEIILTYKEPKCFKNYE
uniref:Lipocalin n=1 Tax=Rhipicephalus appendiculatus TaxID=34631 RepID=A0A131YZY9_RHIAP